ncbi:unnamed protein product [Didymodactylos carnosus]|uniref:Uncharacterized protein n=1 Tax=Didymodactylos carnosus TaxID=1234261 RepID=A0A813X0X9_9BILA|nr:unnamed protein product [Didymodactylos carnosus]CAF1227624.1 unnamed protein product [Didymodactylos carnosus]CAF3653670.1 unnamed protein product [Didymodactylos carnosus]CAF4035580.1 unnamed protein product [Didymodactylos carnosus]
MLSLSQSSTTSIQTKLRSVQIQTSICVESMCSQHSEVVCRHCNQHYCYLCFMSHRRHILNEMSLIHSQMVTNRSKGVEEVVKFINKQAQDAQDQAKQLVDDAINRIMTASKNIYQYIDNRRQAKLGRLNECLEKFDKDKKLLQEKLVREIFLSADILMDFRKKYAYNMFDHVVFERMGKINEKPKATNEQEQNEEFFSNYRFYDELINLRQKWTFFQAALTTVYFPSKKDISLDKILTFLEYRHDRVLENYREHLSSKEETKVLSLKTSDELLNELSFFKFYNFYYTADECVIIPDSKDQEDFSQSTTTSLTTNQESNTAVVNDSKKEEITATTIEIIEKPPALLEIEDKKHGIVISTTTIEDNNNNDDDDDDDDDDGSSQDGESSWQAVNYHDYEDDQQEHDTINAKKLTECDQNFQKLVDTLRKVENQFDIKAVM